VGPEHGPPSSSIDHRLVTVLIIAYVIMEIDAQLKHDRPQKYCADTQPCMLGYSAMLHLRAIAAAFYADACRSSL
jgi:hypothetical protein